MNWNEIFRYEDGLLFWKISPSYRIKEGAVAGNKTGNGYWQVCYKGKFYKLHRVIWEMFNPPIEGLLEIDHIDRNLNNNKLENLRLASRQLNALNRGVQSNNLLGIRGVSLDSCGKGFRSFIKENGKTVNLGLFKTAEACSAVYEKRLQSLTEVH